MRVWFRVALALVSVLLAWPGSLLAADAGTDSTSSHTAFVRELRQTEREKRRELVARYDRRIADDPGDFRIAIERCDFIAASGGDPDDPLFDEEAAPVDGVESPAACVENLDTRFGKRPEVVLHRLGRMWGDKAADYAATKLADPSIAWTPADRSRALGVIARWRHFGNRIEEAKDAAQLAAQNDPWFDDTLYVGEYLSSVGRRSAAIESLSSRIDDDKDAASLVRKARLLADLDAPSPARRAIDRAATLDEHAVEPLLRARLLEANGDIGAARDAYAAAPGAASRREALTRVFEIDLARADGIAATTAYRALRATGWQADPLARHRLALSLRHPLSPWQLADLVGLLALVVLFTAAAMAPGIVLLPVHYAGLVRRARGAPPVGTRFGLRHAWMALGMLGAASLVAMYVYAYPELAAIFDEQTVSSLSQRELARVGLLLFTLNAATAAVFLERSDLRNGSPSVWWYRGALGRAFLYLLVVMAVGYLNVLVIRATSGPSAGQASGLAFSTLEILRAIKAIYGTPVVLLFAVVLVPLAEEFLFREVVLSGLSRHVSFGWANVIQAAVFALLHDDIARMPTLLALGLGTGLLRRRTGGIATSVLLHGLNNLLASLAVALG